MTMAAPITTTGSTPKKPRANGHVATPHEEEGKASRVPLKDIRLDSAYQRDLDSSRVNRLMRDYDPQLAGALILSARAGLLWCVDGQHRMAAMKELGLAHANAVVFEGLTQRQEADLFIKYNRNRKTLLAWDWFKAELVAGHEEALAITTICNRAGFQIEKTASHTAIQAVNAVRRIYRLGDDALLTDTLDAVKRHWLGKTSALSAAVLEGLAIFYHSCRPEPQYDDKRTEGIFESLPPLVLMNRAREIAAKQMKDSLTPALFAEAIRDRYNERLGAKKKLGYITRRRP